MSRKSDPAKHASTIERKAKNVRENLARAAKNREHVAIVLQRGRSDVRPSKAIRTYNREQERLQRGRITAAIAAAPTAEHVPAPTE